MTPSGRDQAMDQVLAGQPLKVPLVLVHSLWDAEDIYGDIAVYKAIKPKDTGNDKVFLVIGPWAHGGRHRADQTLEVGRNPRPASLALVTPEQLGALALPADEGSGRYHPQCAAPIEPWGSAFSPRYWSNAWPFALTRKNSST